MKAYLDLLQTILDTGSWQQNRTGIRTLAISGACLKFDLQQGYPAVTTRKLPFKTFMGEMVGFLRGSQSAAEFRALGCKIWDQNANENSQWLENPYRDGMDDLGRIYGVQWRHWRAYKTLPAGSAMLEDAATKGYRVVGQTPDGGQVLLREVDQLRECLDKIVHQPTDRRILFHAWNPADIDEMALPPCHLLYQFNCNVAARELSLCLYQRSTDAPLGLVGNLAEGAALLTLFGRLAGYQPKWLSWFGSDVHIYENQMDMVGEQLKREPFPPPRLLLSERVPDFASTGRYAPEWLDLIEPGDFSLEGYRHHEPLTAPMAV
jgi:thymidylate synthase